MTVDNPIVKGDDTAKMNTQSSGSLQHSSRGRRRRAQRGSTYSGWIANKALKLFVWYALITVLFRCPAREDLTDDSPRICKPYLQAKDFVTPYAQPYYDQYLSPYVQKVQPYYEQFNTNVYQPGQAAYTKYAAPRVADAQKISVQQWEKTVKPQLDVLQQQAGKQYQAVLGPHVKKATDVVQPYYNSVVNSASDIWELELEPVYRKTSPYVQKLYVQGQDFAVKTALPHAQYAGNIVWAFWSRQVWPRVRILYGENVEPQLMRITERLGRYKDGKKLEAGIASMENSSKLAEASSSAESIASSLSSTASVVTESPSSAASSVVSASSTPGPEDDPTSRFHEDLKNWEQITAKAVEEGAEDLKERIKDITAHQATSGKKVGGALVVQLEQTTETALDTVKARIQAIVEDIPEDADDARLERANEDLTKAIRAVGQTVKSRAQAVREWRQTSQKETDTLINKAVQSTLEVVDHIRELRLTEIGRKYASTSLPHKEWSKYNDLKKATQTWRTQIEEAAETHPGVKTAKDASEDIEQTAMAIAEDAAKELGRLKTVGKWKIAAADASDDFETKTIPAPMRRLKDQIVEKVAEASEAVVGTEQGTVESVSSVAAEKASEYASSASEAVVGSSTGSVESVASQASSAASSVSAKVVGSTTGSVESVASQASSSAESAASQASSSAKSAASEVSSAASSVSEKVVGSSTGSIESAASQVADSASSVSEKVLRSSTGSIESAASQVVDSASSLAHKVVGSPTGSVESAASRASKSAESAASQASSSVSSASSQASKSAPAAASQASSSVSSVSSQASKSAPSAASQASGSAASASSKASKSADSAASQASSSVSSASSQASKSAPKVASQASQSAHSAASQASSSAESIASVVSDKVVGSSTGSVESAASAVSETVIGTQSGLSDSATDAASSVSSAAQDAASSVSSAVAGDGHAKVAEASKSASSIVDPPAASKASSSVSSAASHVSSAVFDDEEENAASAESIASEATDVPKKVWGGAMAQAIVEAREPILDDDIVDGDGSYSASMLSIVDAAQDYASQLTQAVEDALKGASPTQGSVESVTSLASEQYESAMAAASSALFGTTQNIAEQGTSLAREQYLSAVTAASYAIYGTPMTAAPFAHATSVYSNAMSEAGKHYEMAMSRISAQISGTPAPVHEQMFASVESGYFAAVQAANSRFSSVFTPRTQGTYESISSIASSRLADSLSAASAQYQSAKIAVGAEPTPVHQQYLASAQAAYYQALGVAHGRYSEFVDAASSAVAPTSTTGVSASAKSMLSAAESAYSAYVADASSKYSAMSAAATDTAGSTFENIQEQLAGALAIAGNKLSEASASASSALSAQTADQPILESVTSRASENWVALISKASENVYGAPAPFTDVAYSQITSYGAQATDAAVAQWDQVSALFSELIVGKEPDFTDSVYSRLQSAYATGAPAVLSSASSLLDEGASSASSFVGEGASSASSFVSEGASSASSYASEAYESAASVVSAVFVPPTEVPSILDQVTEQLNAAVEAASQQVYGTSAGYVEQASSAASSAYSAASSAVYDSSPSDYASAAQSSFSNIGASASSAISAAIYGQPTPSLSGASSAAASVYSSVLDQASSQASAASAAVSSAIYGEEETYFEGVQVKIQEAVASAEARLREMGVQATDVAGKVASQVEEAFEQITERVKDEL